MQTSMDYDGDSERGDEGDSDAFGDVALQVLLSVVLGHVLMSSTELAWKC